jgi:tRNA pseudouridine32 synthase/23S rRNA pseudouridine746 synthase
VPAARGGLIDQPIARIATRPPRYGVVPVDRGGRRSLTRWRRLADPAAQSTPPPLSCCPLLLQPLTGRSHQLRVHLAWLGHPLLGDPLYAEPEAGAAVVPRLQLQAVGLRLRHPVTGRPLRFRRPGADPGADPLN